MKQCSKCEDFLSLENFHKSKSHKGGFYTICKKCRFKERKRPENKQKQKEYDKKLHLNEEWKSKRRNKVNKQYREDAHFRLHRILSVSIKGIIKTGFKGNVSILKFLPYSIEELKNHLENQFESWMNWKNHGRGDNTWNIDHIIPQSKLLYDSYEHPNFLKCWNLGNLRPLESKENIRKGNKECAI